MAGEGIDPETFKDMMASVAATVTVVTGYADTEPIGLTVSAFSSVSVEPPIVLICIDSSSASLETFVSGPGFTVNFLPEDAGDVAMLFASKGADKFGSRGWAPPSVDGAGPTLDASFGFFECQTIDRFEMGDHWVIFGRVDAATRNSDSRPCVWLGRGFVRTERA